MKKINFDLSRRHVFCGGDFLLAKASYYTSHNIERDNSGGE